MINSADEEGSPGDAMEGRKKGRDGEKKEDREEERERGMWGILGSTKGFFSIHCRGRRAWEWRGFRYLVTL